MPVRHTYFFALQPDAVASARIGDITRDLIRRRPALDRPMSQARLHVSLQALVREAEPRAEVAALAARAMAAVRQRPFVVAFNRIAMFGRGPGPYAAVLRRDEGVLGVDLLCGEIRAALAQAGLGPRRERAFEAHLTLARGDCAAPEVTIPPVAWSVRDFVLIHSHVGETRYEVAGRFPLVG